MFVGFLRNSFKQAHKYPISCQQLQHSNKIGKTSREVMPKCRRFSSSVGASSSKVGFIGWYLQMLDSRPILTKAITCTLIVSAADLTAQTIVAGSFSGPYDVTRTLRVAGFAMLILGPSLHIWYNALSKFLPKRDVVTILKKIALGQVLYGPTMNAILFSINAAAQGETSSEIVARLKRDLVPTAINGLMYWPICDFITFKFVPVHLQPLAANTFSYVWSIYLMSMASQQKVEASA